MAQSGASICMRGLQGLGAALVNPAALAIVLSMFPAGPQRSKAVALWGTIGSMGIAAGMLAGGILVQYLGWRSVLYVNVPVAIVIAALASSYLPRDRNDEVKHRLDVLGAVLLTAGGSVTFVYTIESIPRAARDRGRRSRVSALPWRSSLRSSPSSEPRPSRSSRCGSFGIRICFPARR